jgi:hypothetical protein
MGISCNNRRVWYINIVLPAVGEGGDYTLDQDLNFQSERYKANHQVPVTESPSCWPFCMSLALRFLGWTRVVIYRLHGRRVFKCAHIVSYNLRRIFSALRIPSFANSLRLVPLAQARPTPPEEYIYVLGRYRISRIVRAPVCTS